MTETWTLADLVAEAETCLEALPPPKNGQVRAVPDDRTVRYYATLGLLDRPAAMRGRTALYGPRHLAQIVAIKRMQSAGHSLADIQQLWPTLDDATLIRISGVKIPDASIAAAPIAAAPIAAAGKGGSRKDFWKREVDTNAAPPAPPPMMPSATTPSATPYRYPAPPASMPSPAPSPFAPMPSPIEIPAPPYAPFNPSVPLEIPPPPPAQPFTQPPPAPLPHIPFPSPQVPTEPPHAPVELRIEIAPGVAISIALPEDAPVSISPADIRALRAAAASLVTELANRGLTARASGTMEEKP